MNDAASAEAEPAMKAKLEETATKDTNSLKSAKDFLYKIIFKVTVMYQGITA